MSGLKAVRFNADRHYKEVAAWWVGHRQAPIPKADLPCTGFIVPGVCAGFVYFTDSTMAIIEGLVSNPETTAQLRDHALNTVVECLCFEAELQGFHNIHAFTQLPQVVQRAKRHGFQAIPGSFHCVTRRV